MENEILSVGIDIGTTTTQLIFSKLYIQNTVSTFLIPEVKITKKELIYKSNIYFTPLLPDDKIDLVKVKAILSLEYNKASINKKDISTGAIIITGETARKENAEEVLSSLSEFAGDFVIATAGPDLEGILAGFGAGASETSKSLTAKILNFDVGGGTTNAAMFWEEEAIDAYALNIGGRLVKFDEGGAITYISSKIQWLLPKLNINLKIGIKPKFEDLKKLTDFFAKIFFQLTNDVLLDECAEKLFINHRNKPIKTDFISFSGGVAEFIYNNICIDNFEDVICFGDIGPLLGCSIRKIYKTNNIILLNPIEKIRATVIGAGIHSIKLSGSTVMFDSNVLPIKNIPIIKLFSETENLNNMYEIVTEKIKPFEGLAIALAFKGPKSPSYVQIKTMAEDITKALSFYDYPIIIIVENDFAKALGLAIKNILKASKAVICLDNIKALNGDYIDIGNPLAGVVPVVVKTLIFKN